MKARITEQMKSVRSFVVFQALCFIIQKFADTKAENYSLWIDLLFEKLNPAFLGGE